MTGSPASHPWNIAPEVAVPDEHLLELLPVAAYVCDAGGHLVRFNRRAVELWGCRPRLGDPEETFCGAYRLLGADGRALPRHETPAATVLRTGAALRNEEVWIEHADGSRFCVLASVDPILDAQGRVAGAITCCHDITARTVSGQRLQCAVAVAPREQRPLAAEEAGAERRNGVCVPFPASAASMLDEPGKRLRADLTDMQKAQLHLLHLASIVQSSQDAIVSKNLDGIIQSWNPGAERLFGYTADEAVGRFIGLLMPADRQDEEPEILARIRRGERVEHYETVRRRKDGTLLDISITVSPLRNAGGAIIGASKIARDITERKRHERRQQLLIHELNHRVKNALAMVQSIAAHTFRADAGNVLAQEFESRILALAKAHDLLTQESWAGASLREIVTAVIAPVCDPAERVEVDGADVQLRPQTTLSLTMALHELCTNAVKYGALSTPEGRVRLEWRLAGSAASPRLQLRWTERGGPPVAEPERQGFGTRLLQRVLAHELDARVQLSFAPSGFCYTLDAPLAAVQEAAPDGIDSTA